MINCFRSILVEVSLMTHLVKFYPLIDLHSSEKKTISNLIISLARLRQYVLHFEKSAYFLFKNNCEKIKFRTSATLTVFSIKHDLQTFFEKINTRSYPQGMVKYQLRILRGRTIYLEFSP